MTIKKKVDIDDIKRNIIKNTEKIILPKEELKFSNTNENLYNDIHKSNKIRNRFDKQLKFKMDKLPEQNYNVKKICLILTVKQMNIIDKWMYGFKEMYNECLKYIKEN